MTEKEKAKAYDEALKKASAAHKDEDRHLKATLERIFPELKEDDGERIKKELIQWVDKFLDIIWRGHYKKDIIAWLEKQRKPKSYWKPTEEQYEALDYAYNSCPDTERGNYYEGALETLIEDLHMLEKQGKKSTDKIEPRFKVGDWLCANELNDYANLIKIVKIVDVFGKKRYKISRDYDSDLDLTEFDFIEKHYHLWTIQDAKDGDVLYSLDSNQPFIYKKRNYYEQATAYCGLNMYGKFFVWSTKDCTITLNNYVPATKEQRDALMKAMNDAGYEWDVEKKELKKKVK